MRVTKLRLLAIGASLIVGASFLALGALAPNIVDSKIPENVRLIKDTKAAQSFRSFPFNLTQRIYFFNITNYDEFMDGAKPSVEELGPYTFISNWTKQLSWEGDQVFFHENKTFWFAPELSNGTLEDVVYGVDLVYLAAFKMFDKLPSIIKAMLQRLLKLRTVLCKHTVREFLYDGYPDNLAALAHLFKPDLPVIDGKVGYLLGLNGSSDGLYSIYSGVDNHVDQINEITSFRNLSYISYFKPECDELYGTNGETFPPFLNSPPKSIDLFNPFFCKPWRLYHNGTDSFNGLSFESYNSGNDFLTSTGNSTLDHCYQTNPSPLRGLFDVSKCQFNQDLAFSLPHFYKGDPKLLEQVDGLNPDPKKHDFGLGVHRTGIVADIRVRNQINAPLRADLSNTSYPHLYYPILWQEIILLDPDQTLLTNMLYEQTEKPRILIETVGFAIGSVALFIMLLLMAYWTSVDLKKTAPENDTRPIIQPYEEQGSVGK